MIVPSNWYEDFFHGVTLDLWRKAIPSEQTKAESEFLLNNLAYDGAFCFGNSFAFLEYADMEKFLSGIARALKPNTRFIIETGMAAESVLRKFEEEATDEIGDITFTTRERYLAEESCIESEYIFERDGKTETRLAKEWIYTVAEIRRMLARAGFLVLELYGSLKCEAYKLGSEE